MTATPHRGAQLRSSLPSPPRTAGWRVRCWLDHHQHLQFRKGEIKKEIAVVGGDRKHEAKLRCLFPLVISQSVSGFLILPTHPTADRWVTLSLQALVQSITTHKGAPRTSQHLSPSCPFAGGTQIFIPPCFQRHPSTHRTRQEAPYSFSLPFPVAFPSTSLEAKILP